jgi:hypothetical protein
MGLIDNLRGFGRLCTLCNWSDVSKMIDEEDFEQHKSEINKYLQLLKELNPEEVKDCLAAPLELYLSKELPGMVGYFKKCGELEISVALENGRKELKESYQKKINPDY